MLSINIGRHYGDVGSGFVLQAESYLGADDGVCIGHGGVLSYCPKAET